VGNRAPLNKSLKQHVPDTLADIIETIVGLAQGHQAKTPETTPAKEHYGSYKNNRKYPDIRRHSLLPFWCQYSSLCTNSPS
jgi:hypothetical protein